MIYRLRLRNAVCVRVRIRSDECVCVMYHHFLQFLQYHRSLEFQMLASICSQVSWYHCLHLPLHRIILSFWLSGIRQWQWISKVSTLTGWEIGLRACLRGNGWICPFLMHWRKCCRISTWSNVHAVGSVLELSAVAKARANKPQSDTPFWCCTFLPWGSSQ